MKSIRFICYILLLSLLPLASHSQARGTLSTGISQAFKSGNASDLSSFFNTKIELITPDNSDIHSKQQAQFIMRDFFQSFSPTSFALIHEGVRENATFAIGKLFTSRGNFRVVILTKNENGKELIHQLRIEKQDD